MLIDFYKYHGCGNDFIIIDCSEKEINLNNNQIKLLCHRNFGIGADGLMLYKNAVDADFELIYYNADGSTNTLCGNGSRCIVQFTHQFKIQKEKYQFKASDGFHSAEIVDGIVKLKMNDVGKVKKTDGQTFFLNTGSPHYIEIIDNVENLDVVTKGKIIRYSEQFAPNGTNVNFVQKISDSEIFVRTYERGVENETLSCGTGVTAAALVTGNNDFGFNKIKVKSLGGEFCVEYMKHNDHFTDIWLCGPALFVFMGKIELV